MMWPEPAVGPFWSPVHASSSQLEPSYCLPLCPRPMVLAYTHLMVDTKQEERKGPESRKKKIRRQVPSDLLTLLKFPEHSKTVASNEDQVSVQCKSLWAHFTVYLKASPKVCDWQAH